MRKMVYICDKCGRVITKNEKPFVIRVNEIVRCANGLETPGDTHPDYGDDGKELCEQCANNLLKVDEPKGGKEDADSNGGGADPVHITDKGDHKIVCDGRQIDLGKIFALKKAGWKNTQIADEFGVDSNAIGGVIYRNKTDYESFLAGKWEVKEENEFGD